VAGELSADAFLADAGWAEVWGFDAELYLPLFEFARLHPAGKRLEADRHVRPPSMQRRQRVQLPAMVPGVVVMLAQQHHRPRRHVRD
jgi:hypothetical protein